MPSLVTVSVFSGGWKKRSDVVSNQPLVELGPPPPRDLQATDRSDVVAEHGDGFTEEEDEDIMTLIRHELEKFLAAQHRARPGGGPVSEVAATPSKDHLGAGDAILYLTQKHSSPL